MSTLKKPSPAQVQTKYNEQTKQVELAVNQSIVTIVADYTNKLTALNNEKLGKITEASKQTAEAISASEKTVDEKTQAYDAALKAVYQAGNELDAAEKAHKKTTSSLKQSFNKAAKDLKKSFAADREAANKARQAALAAEKQKVADAKAAGRSATWAETKALVDYEIFVIKDTTVRFGNGMKAVGKALTTAFNTGYNGESGVALPKSLLERQDKPANDQQPTV